MPFATAVNPYVDVDPRDPRDRECVDRGSTLTVEQLLDFLGQ